MMSRHLSHYHTHLPDCSDEFTALCRLIWSMLMLRIAWWAWDGQSLFWMSVSVFLCIYAVFSVRRGIRLWNSRFIRQRIWREIKTCPIPPRGSIGQSFRLTLPHSFINQVGKMAVLLALLAVLFWVMREVMREAGWLNEITVSSLPVLTMLAAAFNVFLNRMMHSRQIRYHAQKDIMSVWRLNGLKWQKIKQLKLANYVGVAYVWQPDGAYYELILVGRERDVLLAKMKAIFDNREHVCRVSQKIAKQTGLPLLQHIDFPERTSLTDLF